MVTESRSSVAASPSQVFFGAPVGILLLDCVAPYIPGSVGNAGTYSVPVRYKQVSGLTVELMLSPEVGQGEAAVVAAARELVSEGAQLITANCGFAIAFQRSVAVAVDVPVLLSSLLLAPLLQTFLGPQRGLGILTASAASLSPAVLSDAGLDPGDPRIAVAGMDGAPAFTAGFIDCVGDLDIEATTEEVVGRVRDLQTARPDIGAVLLECSEFPPYAAAVQRATGLPTFDFTSLIEFGIAGLRRTPFAGFM